MAAVHLVADLVVEAVAVPAVPAATVVEAVVVTAPVAGVDIREAAVPAEEAVLAVAAAAGVVTQAVEEDPAKSIRLPLCAALSPSAPRPLSCRQLVRLNPPIVRRRQSGFPRHAAEQRSPVALPLPSAAPCQIPRRIRFQAR